MTHAQEHTCRNCGDLFTAPERPCPHPSPGREYKETGRGGHMFYPRTPPAPSAPMTRERLQEIEILALEALNALTGERPPYGDTSGRFYLETAKAVLETLEHASPSMDTQDTLFVELRLACAEVEQLQRAAATVPELLTEVDRLRVECKRLRRVGLETTGLFTHEQIERMLEVDP